ncbi:MAG: methionine--tRNA ligase subunit beta [Candidatus Levybacteria bacterium]|nr:methionine--tRNA ligase subunit beta [Candidatus Levybacteria bacterium]
MATIDDFSKLDLRVVKVTEASRMEGSDKLLKLLVSIGSETRQILSGIGRSYEPDDIIGKELIAIVNLDPRMMMGEESQGMILATGDDLENITLIQPDKEVEPGSKIR